MLRLDIELEMMGILDDFICVNLYCTFPRDVLHISNTGL